jgi:hypothetical protein
MGQARKNSGKERGSAKDETIAVVVDGVEVQINPHTLTMKERQLVRSVLSKLEYDVDDMDVMTATVWVVMKRTDSALTFDDVSDSLTIQDLEDARLTTLEETDVTDPNI